MTATLAKALVAVQKEMPAIKPDRKNNHYGNDYVTLEHLLAKALPVLNAHGVAVVQFPSQNEMGAPTLTTRLVHESGESMESSMPLYLLKNDPQAHGSALTYARRYSLAAALGISDEKDDDGEAATAPAGQQPPQREQTFAQPAAPAAAAKPVRTPTGASTGTTAADPLCTFGKKHNGKRLSEILKSDSGYIQWVLDKFEPRNPDQQTFVDACRDLSGQPKPAGVADGLDDIPFDRTSF